MLQETLQNDEQGLELNRFGEKVVGALFDRSHGQVDGSKRRQDDQRRGGIDIFETRQEIKRMAIREHVIDDDRIRPGRLKEVQRPLATIGLVYFVALRLQKIADTEASRNFIIND
jgi:hypothetical protein